MLFSYSMDKIQKSGTLLDRLHQAFADEEWGYIVKQKEQLLRRYRIIQRKNTDHTSEASITDKDVVQGKNLTIMYGGGKDSGIMLAGARAIQLLIKKDLGVAPELRVCIGEHSGMVDGVYQNIANAITVLELENDPTVDVVWINRNQARNEQVLPTQVPKPVQEFLRKTIVQNGHLFSGAGRRTFCDSCNLGLGQWISTALAFKNGADVFMTGDNKNETSAQIDGSVPEMQRDLGIHSAVGKRQTRAQNNFVRLEDIGKKHTELMFGPDAERMGYQYLSVPEKTQFMPFFGENGVSNEIGKRFEFLKDFLNMDYSTLAFSFTESDCGNPALMCHIYALISELAYGDKGATYADGVRMFLDYIMPKVEEKKFPPEFIKELRKRYENEEAISQTRKSVENYAHNAYGLSPDNIVAMVFAPFTQKACNLKRYLDYLSKKPRTDDIELVLDKEKQIKAILESNNQLSGEQKKIVDALEALTAIPLQQMREFYNRELFINNFDPAHQLNGPTEHALKTLDNDLSYIGDGKLMHNGEHIATIKIRAR